MYYYMVFVVYTNTTPVNIYMYECAYVQVTSMKKNMQMN